MDPTKYRSLESPGYNQSHHPSSQGNNANVTLSNVPQGNILAPNDDNGQHDDNGTKNLQYPTFQNIEPNTSYTRTKVNEEDERFFKLAKEAIVHTANATASNQQIADPTLNDLFTRLQYVSSPHGNPIKSGENIKVNENGQLMIHEFYDNFPNFNNNVFQNSRSNQLIGENPLNHLVRHNSQSLGGSASNSTTGTGSSTSVNLAHHNNGSSTLPHIDALPPVLNPAPPITGIHPLNPSLNHPIHPINHHLNSGTTSPNNSDKDEERKYECNKCFMNFKRSSDLKRHEKQHLSIPPNICEFCGKGFARKDALKRHVGTATCKRNAEKRLYIDNLEFLK